MTINKDLTFIMEIIQRGRIKPAKYKHYLSIPRWLYDEITEIGLIDFEYLYISEQIFIETSEENRTVRLNFIGLSVVEDIHVRLMNHLIVKYNGRNPIKRGGTMFASAGKKKYPEPVIKQK